MNWIKRILNGFFKNLYLICVCIFLSALIVLLINMSAQFIGNKISKIVLNNKSVDVVFVTNKNSEKETYLINKLVKTINEDCDIKKYNLKLSIVNEENVDILKKNGKIVFFTKKDFFNNFSSKHNISILEHAILPDRTQIYAKFSEYNEYIFVETTIDDFKIYVCVVDVETNLEKLKINKTLNHIFNNILRKMDLQPEA